MAYSLITQENIHDGLLQTLEYFPYAVCVLTASSRWYQEVAALNIGPAS